jgi:TetR/AcrR family transcriptional repressor of nem operon
MESNHGPETRSIPSRCSAARHLTDHYSQPRGYGIRKQTKRLTLMGRTSSARRRLLNAASDLLWEKSYHSVTLDEVCARAGVRKGSLYHFFDSKISVASAALQHFWETLAKPAYERHFSTAIPPLARIICFLDWLQYLQREKHRKVGKILGWPFFTLGCELGAREPAIARRLCDVESAEHRYFESAIRDAIAQEIIEPCVARAEAISLRAAVAGILGRARILDEPEELTTLTALPITILRLKPAGKAMALPEDEGAAKQSDLLPVADKPFTAESVLI